VGFLALSDSLQAGQNIIQSLRTYPLDYNRDIDQYRCQAQLKLDQVKYTTILKSLYFRAQVAANPDAMMLTVAHFSNMSNKKAMDEDPLLPFKLYRDLLTAAVPRRELNSLFFLVSIDKASSTYEVIIPPQ
jgi:hypothetical protein